jgi:hypothetical protein
MIDICTQSERTSSGCAGFVATVSYHVDTVIGVPQKSGKQKATGSQATPIPCQISLGCRFVEKEKSTYVSQLDPISAGSGLLE